MSKKDSRLSTTNLERVSDMGVQVRDCEIQESRFVVKKCSIVPCLNLHLTCISKTRWKWKRIKGTKKYFIFQIFSCHYSWWFPRYSHSIVLYPIDSEVVNQHRWKRSAKFFTAGGLSIWVYSITALLTKSTRTTHNKSEVNKSDSHHLLRFNINYSIMTLSDWYKLRNVIFSKNFYWITSVTFQPGNFQPSLS